MTRTPHQGTPGEPKRLPESFGRYQVTGYLGQGSFGPIYEGRHPTDSRDVAIKTCTAGDEALHRRFVGEAETARSLDHERIVRVWDFGTDGATPYLVEERLGGQRLDEALEARDAGRPLDRLGILTQVAEALAYAHGRGIVHRGLQPGVVRWLDDGRVKVHDFGIARLASEESQLTQKGVTLGTAAYLAPEQVRGADVDMHADVFSFGVLAYELLTARRPFRGRTLSALVYQILYKPPAPLTAVWPDAPSELVALVDRCLEKEQTNRYPDAQRLLDDLQGLRALLGPDQLASLERPSVAQLDGTLPGAAEDPLSRSMISRAADQAASPADGRPGASERTQRIAPAQRGAAKTAAPGRANRREPTQGKGTSATQPVVPPLEATSDGTGEPNEKLADTAEEISQLVAQGELHKALEHLEETMGRHGETVATDDALPTVALRQDDLQPSAPPSDRPVEVLSLDQAMVPTARIGNATIAEAHARAGREGDAAPAAGSRPPALPDPGSPAPGSPAPDSPAPGSPAPGSPPASPPEAPPSAPPPATPVVPSAATPASRSQAPAARPATGNGLPGPLGDLPKPVLLGGAAALALLLLIGLGMMLFSGSDEPEPAVESAEAAPREAPPVVAPAPAETSGLAIDSQPWAYVREVTDSEGFVHDLPVDAATPFFLSLPPGEYRVVLEREGVEEPQTCEAVEVGDDVIARCVVTFGDEPISTREFFRDSGWWQ